MASDFGKEVRELLTQAEEADLHNREEAKLDLQFVGGDQWDVRDSEARSKAKLPVITNNIVQQYTNMVVGDWLQNETSIKCLPREDADVNTAEVISEVIRSIELQSKAQRVYARAFDQMVTCGISNMRVDVDYACEGAFDKDIFIRSRPDPLSTRWDPLAFDPTGRDAEWCFDSETVTVEAYKKQYKDAALPSVIQRECGTLWANNKTVQLPDYWKMTDKLRTFGMTADGKTVDLTDLPKKKWPQLSIDSDTKQPLIREKVKCRYAVMVKTNGMEALSDPYELKLSRLPIIRVMGRETLVDGKRIRSGLVRWMRDHQRMMNYLASIRTELLMEAARVNFTAQASAIEGREDDWQNTLVYNDGAPEPKEVTGRNLSALLSEEQFLSQGMMNVTGIHEANRGMQGNETSGRAILARQNEGDTATIVYHVNMTDAQQEVGEVINQLRPSVYDSTRTLRTVGPDLAVKMVRINDSHPALQANGSLNIKHYAVGKFNPEAQNDDGSPKYPGADPRQNPSYIKDAKKYQGINASVPDLTAGTYDITISTGPSYQTRRQEAATQMMQLIQARPDIASVIGDLVVSEMDLVNGDKIAERLKATIPPQVLGDDAQDGKSPEEIAQQQQAAQQAQQMQQAQVQMQMQGAQAELALKQAQAQEAQSRAMLAQAQAQKAQIEAEQMANGGAPDPSVAAESQRTAIMGYDAVTRRLAMAEKGDMPGTPPLLEQHLAPIIAKAVGQALAGHLGFSPVELGLPSAEPVQPDNESDPSQGIAA